MREHLACIKFGASELCEFLSLFVKMHFFITSLQTTHFSNMFCFYNFSTIKNRRIAFFILIFGHVEDLT